jgi:dsRNA-specific ribonuclease
VWQDISEPKQMNVILKKTFALAKLKPHYVNLLLSHEDEYEQAFTSDSFDPNRNYQIYEFLGDGVANAFLVWYFYRRFPQLDCSDGVKILARLKINFGAKKSFASIADRLGFWPYIRASDEEKAIERESLLEDVFEAFVGLTTKLLDDEFEIGVGYGIVYEILKEIFDEMDVSLEHEDLYDAKTRLKELFDAVPALGKVKYEATATKVVVYRIQGSNKVYLGEGEGRLKGDREQRAAEQALELLRNEGYVKRKPGALFCE